MEWLTAWMALDIIGFWEVCLRVVLAGLFGLVLGIDREYKNKPIDFKAYMIVATSSCLVAVLAQEVYADYAGAENVVSVDLGKIVAGVLTGIGFLGAGAIIKLGEGKVVGTATGASIWASGIIGLALGFGFYEIALIGFFTVFLILRIVDVIRPPIGDSDDE